MYPVLTNSSILVKVIDSSSVQFVYRTSAKIYGFKYKQRYKHVGLLGRVAEFGHGKTVSMYFGHSNLVTR